MPGVIVTNTGVTRDGDAITVQFSDGSNLEFESLDQMKTECQPYDTDVTHAKKMMCLKIVRNSPDGADLTSCVGGSLSSEFNADIPIVYTPPE